jgi:hypothetical protein
VAKQRKGDGRGEKPFAPDEQLIVDEIARQLYERRQVRASLFNPTQFALESRARRVAYTKIDAHPTVKVALLMAERLRFIALRVDALLAFYGDPTGPKNRAAELSVAPHIRELDALTAPYAGTPERQRDTLIELVEWAASQFEASPHGEQDWADVISTLRFELLGAIPEVEPRVSDEDLGRSISVFLPPRLRPDWKDPVPKWEQLKALAGHAGLGIVDVETVRVQYTRHRSERRKLEKAEREELARTPLGNKWDGLSGAARQRAEEQIRSIEARALRKLRHPKKP